MSIIYAIWSGVSRAGASTGGLLAIFTISQLVLNAGPNVTTFLLPVEVFPTRVRGTAHGIAAASGKSGAVLTAFAFGTVNQKISLPGVLGLFSGVMALCAVCTLLIPETREASIDDLENEVLFEQPVDSRDSPHSSFAGVSITPKAEVVE
jgi:PHS family inorganic phosphate transporter-like MFS transporter